MTVAGSGTGSKDGMSKQRNAVKTTDWMWGGSSLRQHVNTTSVSHQGPSSKTKAKVVPHAQGSTSGENGEGANYRPSGGLEQYPSTLSELDELGKRPSIPLDAAPRQQQQQLEPLPTHEEADGGDLDDAGEPAKEPLRRIIHNTFDDASYSNLAKGISISMMAIIVLSTVCFILESEATEEGGVLYGGNAEDIFDAVEFVCVVVFTLEYNIRLITCPRVFHFVFDPMNLIDLVAWMPFWITGAVQLATGEGANSSFGFVRIVRLVRVFRVFKFGRYSIGIQMFVGAIVKSRQPLMVLVFMVGISTTIISSIMYLLEDNLDEEMLSAMGVDKSVHSVCFGTIPRTFWWCIVTMTTVGYGDCYPLSFPGKLLAMATMLLGVLILALPITVVGSNFHKMVEMFEEDMDDYGRADQDNNGNIDEMELREFIRKKRRDGLIRKGTDINIQRLMERYDPQGNGTLSVLEFTQLKNDVLDDAKADPAELLKQVMKLLREQSHKIDTMQAHIDRLTIDQGELQFNLSSEGSGGGPSGRRVAGGGGDGDGGDGDGGGGDDAVHSVEPSPRTEDVEDDTNDV